MPDPGTMPPIGRLSEDKHRAPDGSEIRLLAGEPEGAHSASLCQASIAAGQTSRPVRHRQVEEIWYFIEGEGALWRCPPDQDPARVDPTPVRAGDALVIPAGWSFQFRASPAGPLRFLCYTAPAWPGDDEAQPAPPGGLGPPTI